MASNLCHTCVEIDVGSKMERLPVSLYLTPDNLQTSGMHSNDPASLFNNLHPNDALDLKTEYHATIDCVWSEVVRHDSSKFTKLQLACEAAHMQSYANVGGAPLEWQLHPLARMQPRKTDFLVNYCLALERLFQNNNRAICESGNLVKAPTFSVDWRGNSPISKDAIKDAPGDYLKSLHKDDRVPDLQPYKTNMLSAYEISSAAITAATTNSPMFKITVALPPRTALLSVHGQAIFAGFGIACNTPETGIDVGLYVNHATRPVVLDSGLGQEMSQIDGTRALRNYKQFIGLSSPNEVLTVGSIPGNQEFVHGLVNNSTTTSYFTSDRYISIYSGLFRTMLQNLPNKTNNHPTRQSSLQTISKAFFIDRIQLDCFALTRQSNVSRPFSFFCDLTVQSKAQIARNLEFMLHLHLTESFNIPPNFVFRLVNSNQIQIHFGRFMPRPGPPRLARRRKTKFVAAISATTGTTDSPTVLSSPSLDEGEASGQAATSSTTAEHEQTPGLNTFDSASGDSDHHDYDCIVFAPQLPDQQVRIVFPVDNTWFLFPNLDRVVLFTTENLQTLRDDMLDQQFQIANQPIRDVLRVMQEPLLLRVDDRRSFNAISYGLQGNPTYNAGVLLNGQHVVDKSTIICPGLPLTIQVSILKMSDYQPVIVGAKTKIHFLITVRRKVQNVNVNNQLSWHPPTSTSSLTSTPLSNDNNASTMSSADHQDFSAFL